MAASGWFILMCNVYFFSTQIRRVISPFDFVCMFVSSIQPFVLKQVTLPFLHHDGSDKRVLPIVITFAILAIFHIFSTSIIIGGRVTKIPKDSHFDTWNHRRFASAHYIYFLLKKTKTNGSSSDFGEASSPFKNLHLPSLRRKGLPCLPSIQNSRGMRAWCLWCGHSTWLVMAGVCCVLLCCNGVCCFFKGLFL